MAEAPASLNEGALKRFDPYIKEIIDTAKYVALYSFVDNVWTKTKVEGSLFVYARTGEPLYNILVLNRLDSKNLVEPITPQLDIQRNEPYLLYRNSEGKIFGIWFFDVADCVRLTNLIQKLMEVSLGGAKPQVVAPNPGQGVDIFQMLTKAQEAFSAKEGGRPIPPRKQSPKEMDGTPRSVAEFFAKAGSTPNESAILSRTKTISESDQPGLLQQLMANPAHSVEHIEKQQRVVTPHSAEPNMDPLKQFLLPHSSGIDFLSNRVAPDGAHPIPGANGFGEAAQAPVPFTLLMQSQFPATSDARKPLVATATNGIKRLSLKSTELPLDLAEDEKKPDLMPPAMFTPRDTGAFGAVRERHCAPEPLTRNQLLQAFDYLLRNDSEFMTKLHEAYVKSLTDKIY